MAVWRILESSGNRYPPHGTELFPRTELYVLGKRGLLQVSATQLTTKFTRRLGTTISLRNVLSFSHSSTPGDTLAAARISASGASAGTTTRPRTLPLTCTASSICSSTSHCGSAFGQGT